MLSRATLFLEFLEVSLYVLDSVLENRVRLRLLALLRKLLVLLVELLLYFFYFARLPLLLVLYNGLVVQVVRVQFILCTSVSIEGMQL